MPLFTPPPRPRVALALLALAAACDDPRRLDAGGPECVRCHGGGALGAAPPRSTRGETATTARAVGAHEAHLVAGRVAGPVACAECHVVPERVEGHFGDGVTVTFGARAGAAAWDRAAATCSGVYCHGATLDAGGDATEPVWTAVDGSQVGCGGCHGNPPPAPHPQAPLGARCHACHPATVLEGDVAIDVAGGRHVNGALDLAGAGGCDACHPAGGGHLAHGTWAGAAYGSLAILEDVADDGAEYEFGCGHCHPTDAARHLDGTLDVDLSPAGAAAGSLKARNAPGASYAGGTCSGVYCHSSGQAAPAFVATPAWTATGGLGCGGCHGNPPRYATGGPGAASANSHLGLSSDGWESGHFAGLPGPWHTSYHGRIAREGDRAVNAAPITCQTCHYETTDPAAAGPSGFYWLDTTGDYALAGGDPARLGSLDWQATQCATCHGAGLAPTGTGRVLPLRHVNGRRDVVFDPRLSLPALSWAPAAPDAPTRPYWVTAVASALPADAAQDGETLSLHLGSARWTPATKTCTSVACHLSATGAVWGGLNAWEACSSCHGDY